MLYNTNASSINLKKQTYFALLVSRKTIIFVLVVKKDQLQIVASKRSILDIIKKETANDK